MGSSRRSMDTPRYLAMAVAAGLLMSLWSGPTMAADAPADGSLCSTISIEQLNELAPVGLEVILFDTGDVCAFGPSLQGGTPTLSLVVLGLSLGSMVDIWPDVTEVTVGGRPAAIAEGAVHVDMGDEILTVQLDLGSEEVAGVDPIEYAIDVAEIVVAARGTMPSDTETPDSSASTTLVGPPDVEGIEWSRAQEVVSAQELTEGDEGQAVIWQPMLDAAGASADELFLLSVDARDGANGPIGNYAAVQILGADESTLRAALTELMRVTSGGDVTFDDLTLGGKDVQRLTVAGEVRGIVYFVGDTVHTFTMPEEDAARVLEAMP